MIKIMSLLIIISLTAGCASMESVSEKSASVSVPDQLVDFRPITIGMTHDQVKALLSEPIVIGYEIPESKEGQIKKFSFSNPYRVETINSTGQNYLVEYYLAQIVKADEIISEDELMPLVFQNNILVGKGADYLFKLKTQ